MSQLARIHADYMADYVEAFDAPMPRAFVMGPDDDLSVLLHPEVPECRWWQEYQKRLGLPGKSAYWNMGFGRWVLR